MTACRSNYCCQINALS